MIRRVDFWVFMAALVALVVMQFTTKWLVIPYVVLLAASLLIPAHWTISTGKEQR